MSIGLKSKTVVLEPHQVEWEEEGRRKCAEIKEILGSDAVDVQHVGSTSIIGISAKPIIDIAVAVRAFEDIRKHDAKLAEHGIIYRKEDYPGQHLYRCGDFEREMITHYIHVVLAGSYQWRNYINFRDYLNTHEEDAKAYEKCKLDLWEKYPNDRDAYVEGKSALVTEILGKTSKRVVVQAYDPVWVKDFEDIRKEISEVIGDLVLSIEHVGSTSVKGLSAKPIIDIDVVIEDGTRLNPVISALDKIGYHHRGNLGIPGREAFGYEGKDHLRKHHLYVCEKNAEELCRHIAFRDYLRTHPEAVAEYSRIKTEGAALYPFDIDKYIEYKGPFIEGIYKNIGKNFRRLTNP